MNKTIHARIDANTHKLLGQLSVKTQWNESEIVRRGIKVLAALHLRARPKKLVGVGEFASGISDLGSNKRHLSGFGGR